MFDTVRLFTAIASVMLSSACESTLLDSNDNGSTPTEFIKSANAVSVGKNSVRVELVFTNPTNEPVCIYEGVLDLADIVSSSHPDRVLRALMDDPYRADPRYLMLGSYRKSSINHQRKNSANIRDRFWPNIEIDPGGQYSFTQLRYYGDFVTFFGDAVNRPGADVFAAHSGNFRVAFRGLQVFRCELLDDATSERVADEKLSFGMLNAPITTQNPDGLFWQFSGFVHHEEFGLTVVAPPDGWIRTETPSFE